VWRGCFIRVRGLPDRDGYTKWPCLEGVPRHKKKKFEKRLQKKGYEGRERRGYHLPLVVLLNNRRERGVESSSYFAIELKGGENVRDHAH